MILEAYHPAPSRKLPRGRELLLPGWPMLLAVPFGEHSLRRGRLGGPGRLVIATTASYETRSAASAAGWVSTSWPAGSQNLPDASGDAMVAPCLLAYATRMRAASPISSFQFPPSQAFNLSVGQRRWDLLRYWRTRPSGPRRAARTYSRGGRVWLDVCWTERPMAFAARESKSFWCLDNSSASMPKAWAARQDRKYRTRQGRTSGNVGGHDGATAAGQHEAA